MRTRRWSHGLEVVIASGLVVDAAVHLDVAGSYGLVRTALVSQADLFRVEALVAIVAAAAVILWPSKVTVLFSLLVSAGGVAAVVLYTYVDPGQIGPMPDMFDPVWYPEKLLSLVGEVLAAVGSAALLLARGLLVPSARPWARHGLDAELAEGPRTRG